MASINEIKGFLSQKNVKPSYSRLKVMEYLIRYRNHPTVDEIYSKLVKEIPTLSKTTVYNTLNLFVDENLAIPISIDSNEMRYDATVEQHGHFKCERCGKIYDFSVDIDKIKPEELEGFIVRNKSVNYKGICPHCLNNDKNNIS